MIYLNSTNCQQHQDQPCFPHIIKRWSFVLQIYSSFLCIHLTFQVSPTFIFPICKIHKNNIYKISIYHKRVPESQIYCNSSASRQGSSPGPSQTSQVGRDSLGSLAITSGWEGGRKEERTHHWIHILRKFPQQSIWHWRNTDSQDKSEIAYPVHRLHHHLAFLFLLLLKKQ